MQQRQPTDDTGLDHQGSPQDNDCEEVSHNRRRLRNQGGNIYRLEVRDNQNRL